jgi:hypothetical protein
MSCFAEGLWYKSTPVNRNQAQLDAFDEAIFTPPDEWEQDQPQSRSGDAAGLRADGLLAERCLAGEVAAWEELYGQCHEPLLVSIRIMLGGQSKDVNVVDEIAARVWYALVAKDGERLTRYDPKRGARLVTFLRALAKDEMARHFRGEIRRRKREVVALRGRRKHHRHHAGPPADSLAEFLPTLTPREQVFCNDYLLAEPSVAAEQPYTSANVWQLTHRIYQKLLRFLNAQP